MCAPTCWNSSLSVRSASPAYLPKQSAPFLANSATRPGHLFATSPASALTSAVLPQPGAPCSRMPLGGEMPMEVNKPAWTAVCKQESTFSFLCSLICQCAMLLLAAAQAKAAIYGALFLQCVAGHSRAYLVQSEAAAPSHAASA